MTCSEGGAGRHRICRPDQREPGGQLNPEAAADDPTHQPHACAGKRPIPQHFLLSESTREATIHATCSQRICPCASSNSHVSSFGAVARGSLHPQAASWLNSGNFCEAYALDDRSAMNLTLTFTSAALLPGHRTLEKDWVHARNRGFT